MSEEIKTEIVENKIDETSPQIREQVDVASVEANSANGDLTTEVKVEGNFEEEVSMLENIFLRHCHSGKIS